MSHSCKAFFFLPFLVKKSLEYFPAKICLRGTGPSSSMIKAMWSIPQEGERRGEEGEGWTRQTNDKQTVIKHNAPVVPHHRFRGGRSVCVARSGANRKESSSQNGNPLRNCFGFIWRGPHQANFTLGPLVITNGGNQLVRLCFQGAAILVLTGQCG